MTDTSNYPGSVGRHLPQVLNPLVYQHSHALTVQFKQNVLSSLTHHEHGHTLHGLLLDNAFSSLNVTNQTSIRPGKVHLQFRISHFLNLGAGGRYNNTLRNQYALVSIKVKGHRMQWISDLWLENQLEAGAFCERRVLMRNYKCTLPGLTITNCQLL